MKKRVISALLVAAMLAFTACGGSNNNAAPSGGGAADDANTETLTGEADGFGGPVSVELTLVDGNITAASITADSESPDAAEGPADWKDQLEAAIVAANGSEFDAVSGASVTSAAVKTAVQRAMGVPVEEADTVSEAPAMADPAEIVPIEGGIQIGQAICAPHGEQAFGQITAVVQGDTIIAAYIDEYQFGDADSGVTAVPNGDSDFAAGFAEGKVLFSKRENADYYSDLMAEHANATVRLDDNYDAIQDYVVGKTLSELEGVDAVSGATLADTASYIQGIIEAAKNAQKTQAVEYTGSSDALTLKFGLGAAHGTKCFTTAAVLTDGENVILSYVDEYQFASTDADVQGVPNADKALGENFAEGQILISKRVDADYYSSLMAERGGATVRYDENMNAVQNHANGMSIADVKALAGTGEEAIDAVSGATFEDTANYLGLIADVASK